MKTVTRPKTQWQVRPRQAADGGFAIYDDKGKYRGRAETREEAARLSATLQTPRTWADVGGSHAAHVVGLGEL